MLLAVLTMMAATPLAGRSGSGMQKESAEDHPSDKIWVIVPYTAGSSTDLASRTMGAYFEEQFGRPVVVENMSGACGAISINELLSSLPHGCSSGEECRQRLNEIQEVFYAPIAGQVSEEGQ
jgi:putative tricarboxylic transport membrane protein